MPKDHKVILDLWDDEPLDRVVAPNNKHEHIKLTKVEGIQPLSNHELRINQRLLRSEHPTPIMLPISFPTLSKPTPHTTDHVTYRQQKHTVPMPSVQPEVSTAYSERSDVSVIYQDLHREMPSTRPAPHTVQESSNLDSKLNDGILLMDAEDEFQNDPAPQFKPKEAIVKIDEPWLDSTLGQKDHLDQVSNTAKHADHQLALPSIDFINQNLQDLITSNSQEERIHNRQRKKYSRLRKEYESSRSNDSSSLTPYLAMSENSSIPQQDVQSLGVNVDVEAQVSIRPPIQQESVVQLSEASVVTDDQLSTVQVIDELDDLQGLPSSEELLSELFPSDRPIQINLDKLDEEDIPTAPPLNPMNSQTSSHPPKMISHHSPSDSTDSSAMALEGVDDYIEPLSFTIPPQFNEPIQDFELIKNIKLTLPKQHSTTTYSTSQSNQILKNSKRNIFKATELNSHHFQGYKPAILLSESSLKRRQEMARGLVQGIERYATGQTSFSPTMGISNLIFSKLYPIEIALSSELLSTQLSSVEHEEQLLKTVPVEQESNLLSQDYLKEADIKEDTNFEQEHREFLATVEFQTLLSGSSSAQAPQTINTTSDNHEDHGWDLEKHLNPKIKRNSLSNHKHHKKTPPRLIRALDPSATTSSSHASDAAEANSKEQDSSNMPRTEPLLSSQDQQTYANQSTSTASNNNSPQQDHQAPTDSNPSTHPNTPRPSGHPSVKVRLWGIKQ